MNNTVKGLLIIGGAFLIVALIIFGPLATIWALNALFPTLSIAYTFKTWLASLMLGALVSGNRFAKD